MAEARRATATSAVAIVAVLKFKRKRRIRKRKFWVREWLQCREVHGAYHALMKELEIMDMSSYRNVLRMDSTSFEELFVKIAPQITHKGTNMMDAIPPGERLAVTLRYLATGQLSIAD